MDANNISLHDPTFQLAYAHTRAHTLSTCTHNQTPPQIIYLDADNIPLHDPTFLLATTEYNATGALMWPDFWDNTMAPQV